MRELIAELKNFDEDFEFFPSTDEIVDTVVRDVIATRDDSRYYRRLESVLDIGAGSGKVLLALRERAGISSLYAIEKSLVLIERLDASIFIVGTEFREQSLIGKTAAITYCNPPFSEFEDWAEKIIQESSSQLIYLLLPVRWTASPRIAAALEYREVQAEILGTFDFRNAEEREAQHATAQLLRISFGRDDTDPFERFFNLQFGSFRKRYENGDEEKETGICDNHRRLFEGLVVGPTYPDRLVALYNDEMDRIKYNYELVTRLDVSLLREISVTPSRIATLLKERLAGLRNIYWNELFSNLRLVTDRLTTTRRKHILTTLQGNIAIDFTVSNIHAILVWILKNANASIDDQLIEVFERMVDRANVRNYASNQIPFTFNRWRYLQEKPTHIALEYRLVLEHVGGISRRFSSVELSDRARDFIVDLLTVALNLGFVTDTQDTRLSHRGREEWRANELQCFSYKQGAKTDVLFEVRAFQNGNLHLRLNKKFALALNVEYGRLKGWLSSGAHAADELSDEGAAALFGTQQKISSSMLLLSPVS